MQMCSEKLTSQQPKLCHLFKKLKLKHVRRVPRREEEGIEAEERNEKTRGLQRGAQAFLPAERAPAGTPGSGLRAQLAGPPRSQARRRRNVASYRLSNFQGILFLRIPSTSSSCVG